MKVSKVVAILLVFISTFIHQKVWSKVIAGYMNNYLFYTTDNKAYVETIIQVNALSILYKPTTNKQYQGKIEITLLYYHDTTVVNYYKYILNTVPSNDTTTVLDAIDMKRTELPIGSNRVELLLTDTYNPLHFTQSISQKIKINNIADVSVSDIEFVDHYKPETTVSIFNKNGYEIAPRAIMSYGSSDSSIIFYTEFYHLNLKEKGTITYTYSINNVLNNNPIMDHTGYTRQKAEDYFALFNHMNIADLPKGNYVLNINAYDTKKSIIAHQSVFFKRYTNINSATVYTRNMGVFDKIKKDSLDFYLKAVYYTIGYNYKQNILTCIEGKDTTAKRICLHDFWINEYKEDAEIEFAEFREKVMYVEKAFSAVKKHGFQTDRGRVYLQYGPPDYVEQHRRDLDTYPYDMWQYYQTKDRQNAVLFVFYSIDMTSENFTLIHSSARGEINNTEWTKVVSRTQNPSMFGNSPTFIR